METPLTTPQPKSRWSIFLENIFYIAIAAGLAILVQSFIARPFIVNGTSMDPTFNGRDYLIIDEITYRFREPVRGDVIVFRAPPQPDKYYIKRVIGLPGETVILSGTSVTIKNAAHPDGFVLSEPFITHPQKNELTFVVPEGKYFVLGDNRAGSYDSRSWGSVPRENIRGYPLVRLLPFSNITLFPGEVHYEEN